MTGDEIAMRVLVLWEHLIDEEFSLPWWAWRRRRMVRSYQEAALGVIEKCCPYADLPLPEGLSPMVAQ